MSRARRHCEWSEARLERRLTPISAGPERALLQSSASLTLLVVTDSGDDPYNLERFVDAQRTAYDRALRELKAGRKTSHWMWFVFPQLRGLGLSETSQFYGLSGLDEARAYLAHPVLGARLRQCVEAMLAIENRSSEEALGSIDSMKFRSSMTLFARAAPDEPIFEDALRKFFAGGADSRTLAILQQR